MHFVQLAVCGIIQTVAYQNMVHQWSSGSEYVTFNSAICVERFSNYL